MDAFVALGDTLNLVFAVKNPASNFVAVNAASAPRFKAYDKDVTHQSMANGTGSASFRDTANLTGAANNGSGAIRITCANHGLQTGDRITITGVSGTTEANATWTITKISSSTFDLQSSTFTNAYTSGGTWNITGLYYFAIDVTSGNGYASGSTYVIYITYEISSTTYTDVLRIQVY